MKRLGLAWFGLLAVAGAVYGATGKRNGEIRQSAARAINAMERSWSQWNIPCMSCHHQGLGSMALAPARAHDIPVNEKLVRDHAAKTLGSGRGIRGTRPYGSRHPRDGIRSARHGRSSHTAELQHCAGRAAVRECAMARRSLVRAGRASATLVQQLHRYGVVRAGARAVSAGWHAARA